MAATKLMTLHISKGQTAAQSLTDRLNYIMNPDKTNDGTLITSYGCTAETAAIATAICRILHL